MKLASFEIFLLVLFIVMVIAFYIATMIHYSNFYSKKTAEQISFDEEDDIIERIDTGAEIVERNADRNGVEMRNTTKQQDQQQRQFNINTPQVTFGGVDVEDQQFDSHRETDTGRNFISDRGIKENEKRNSAGIRNFRQIVKHDVDYMNED